MRDSYLPPLLATLCNKSFEWSMRSLEIKIVQYDERHKRAEKGYKCDTICNCSNFMLSDSKHVPMKTRTFVDQ